jgi:hypothetical protein
MAELDNQLATTRRQLKASESRQQSMSIRSARDVHYHSASSSLTKRMRTLEQDDKIWLATDTRLPLSPEASPRLVYGEYPDSPM